MLNKENLMIETDLARKLNISLLTVRAYRNEGLIPVVLSIRGKLALYDCVEVAQALVERGKSELVRDAGQRLLDSRNPRFCGFTA